MLLHEFSNLGCDRGIKVDVVHSSPSGLKNGLIAHNPAGMDLCSSFPPVPFSGSVRPMLDQRAPNEGACSPSQAPSDTSPSQREDHRGPGAIGDNSVRRHLESGKLGRRSSLPITKSSPRKAY